MMVKLPEEIMVDILSRLPITSLCRFRCVSKPWLSLISDPYFIKTHLNRNTTNEKHQHDRLILLSEPCDFHSVDLKSFEFRDHFEALHLKFSPNQSPSDCMEIWGSFDGLLLMLDDFFDCFLLNPSTRQSRKLPKSSFSVNSEYCFDSYGFGYDSSRDDYKVVRISHHDYDYEVDCADNIVSVYNLSTDSWRRIGDSPFDHSRDDPSPGILLDGALHWVTTSVVGSNTSCVIASLDLADETFHSVPCPGSVDDSIVVQQLGVVGGCLCVFVPRHCGCDDVWVMKEYGVVDSWTKFTINYANFTWLKPLSLSSTCEFLFEASGNKFVLCNPLEKKSKELVVQGIPDYYDAETYMETLVSPNMPSIT
ncbi:F-box/kelch-repeat protein [Camellia lanceoleosa]|uniref:F-box/kelch-repeat protein n=1 Tax=Camellia lanceoleosa TaxID=1840588 RepID=A0ACC0GME7_9ERIC|nr:F-box/kelch-repeat protein [Camellia lanceoleosa]